MAAVDSVSSLREREGDRLTVAATSLPMNIGHTDLSIIQYCVCVYYTLQGLYILNIESHTHRVPALKE